MKRILFILIFIPLFVQGQLITTIAGGVTGHGGYWGDGGPATAAEIGWVGSIAVDSRGNLFIADGNNQRIRKVDVSTGIIMTVAGTGVAGYNGDGIQATSAKLNGPNVICLDSNDNIYITDLNNHRIRKVNAVTGIITTYAGNGIYNSSGDGGPATAAQIYADGYTTFDRFGNLFLGNYRSIRKVDAFGTISTVAGTGLPGITGEGVPATSTTIYPLGSGADSMGNIYFADTTSSVRKIAASGSLVHRVAGTGDNMYSPYSGDGLPATLCHIGPLGITVDKVGNIYIADYSNSRIEKVDIVTSTIHTVAGTGVSGYSGDGSLATAAKLSNPEDVAIDACGNIYIADFGNRRIRKITFNPLPCTLLKTNEPNVISATSIFPNPASFQLTIVAPQKITQIIINNLIGQTVYSGKHDSEKVEVNIETLPPGVYLITINGSEVRKFMKQ